MGNRTFLPAIKPNGSNDNGHSGGSLTQPPMAARLQATLAKVLTDSELEAILRQVVEEAKNGSISEKRNARQFLFNMAGAKAAAPQPVYIQKNIYQSGKGKKAKDVVALIVRFLESEGEAGPETIASEIVKPVGEVKSPLAGHEELFERSMNGWRLKQSDVE